MQQRNVRVVIASAHPKVLHLLTEMVEDEKGMTIVGQAENGTRMIKLARSLRPDVAIIDSQLPHKMLLDTVPLSQISGLDTALTTSEEIPNIRVVLLSTDTAFPESITAGDLVPLFVRGEKGGNAPFKLQELYRETEEDQLIFANLQTQANPSAKSRFSAITDKAILYSIFGLLVGFILIITVILAAPGFFVAIIAAATLILGAATKLVSRLWFRMSRPR